MQVQAFTHPHFVYERVVWDLVKGLVSTVNESCRICVYRMRSESCCTWLNLVNSEWVMSHTSDSCEMWMIHVAYEWILRNVSCCIQVNLVKYKWVMSHTGWRRPIGCLKLHVIFCKRATNYRALLQKMTYEDKASYDSTPPCMSESCDIWMNHGTHNYTQMLTRECPARRQWIHRIRYDTYVKRDLHVFESSVETYLYIYERRHRIRYDAHVKRDLYIFESSVKRDLFTYRWEKALYQVRCVCLKRPKYIWK